MNKISDKTCIIISIYTEKAFDKAQHPFMNESLGMEGTYISAIEAIYDKPSVSNILNGEKP